LLDLKGKIIDLKGKTVNLSGGPAPERLKGKMVFVSSVFYLKGFVV
jgi:hypothetical protein